MAEVRNRIRLTAEVPAPREQVFDFLSDHFDEIWQGRMERLRDGEDPSQPFGLGFVRRMHTPAGKLDEEIITHERPSLIEYKVINEDEARFHNHLGRLQLTESGAGSRLDYTVAFDYRPPWQGPLVATAMRAGWALRGRRRLAKRFPG